MPGAVPTGGRPLPDRRGVVRRTDRTGGATCRPTTPCPPRRIQMKLPRTRTRVLAACTAGITVAWAAAVLTANPAQAATGCRVDYTIASYWPGGFNANVIITNY